MHSDTQNAPSPGVVLDFPPAPNRANLTLREVIDARMATYVGRDPSLPGAMSFWVAALGDRRIAEIDADMIADELERFATTPKTKFVGRKPDGSPIIKSLGPRAPATIRRQRAILSGLFTWAQRRRLTPRGWTNPVKEIPPEPVNNARMCLPQIHGHFSKGGWCLASWSWM